MNEVSPVSAAIGDRLRAGIPPHHITKPTIGQLSLAFRQDGEIEYKL